MRRYLTGFDDQIGKSSILTRNPIKLLSSNSLEDFVRADDEYVFGQGTRDSKQSLKGMCDLVHIKIINDFRTISALHSHLNDLNILDPSHLRPDWDTYFMVCALCYDMNYYFIQPTVDLGISSR